MRYLKPIAFLCLPFFLLISAKSQTKIHINQVGFYKDGPKAAVLQINAKSAAVGKFELVSASNNQVLFSKKTMPAAPIKDWFENKLFYKLDFSAFNQSGSFKLKVIQKGKVYYSNAFTIASKGLTQLTIPSIIQYYNYQRANTKEELEADVKISPKGSIKKVDMRGGWADASGDISKYFSHLAYANYMSPQQIPLVAWSLANTKDVIPAMLSQMKVADSIEKEAIYGADYLMRSLTPEGYFYMIIFSHFNKDPSARDIVGLLANSVTTTDYQCAFREGGGMAIAALARISSWKKNGDFTSAQYLDGAKRAFAHLLLNNSKYTDDGKDNIIDDYCALMAATELWIATGEDLYKTEARRRANALNGRMSLDGYFYANDKGRPFWHGSDAGMPIIALSRYLSVEKDLKNRSAALLSIKKALDYNLRVTNAVNNPFGYARQTFKYKENVRDGFFIPQENETGWWWQGENARLASLATAALVGGRLVYPSSVAGNWGVKKELAAYAADQLSWILGGNPYDMCFMYGFGKANVPYMAALFGHGSQKGGISNGITGKEGHGDGSGIDFKIQADGNEWRWTEHWIPHAAWFLQAVTAISTTGSQTSTSAKASTKTREMTSLKPRFSVLAIAEDGGHHVLYSEEAKKWLNKLAADSNFTVEYLSSPKSVTKETLTKYQLIIQLDYPPYNWGKTAEDAFVKYMEKGNGGWIGIHHATLLGEFDGFPLWNWFSDFQGGIKFKNYIADFATGIVQVEKQEHPVLRGLDKKFSIAREEWYTYDKSPRLSKNISVLASVDEKSYSPKSLITMGDHPVIWSNTAKKAKNVYIFMGHSPSLFKNPAYTRLFQNAIFWAATPGK
jgi:type 1 glutamine amidotransferase